jgi:hypothetical protein
MRVLHSVEEALTVARDYVTTQTKGTVLKSPPDQVDGPWGQDIVSAENTFKYVFDKLHHNCYLLCVGDKTEILKLESSTTAPSFKPALTRLNKTIKGNKRKTLLKTLKSKEWRIMQCIVKPYKESVASEYPHFLEGLNLPRGLFLLNITDAVILREDGTEPWHMVSSRPLGEYNFKSYLPILSGSGQKGYWDIPIPNYDDVRLVMGFDKIGTPTLDWNSKKSIAVFRGGPTGCGYTIETNMRLKLAAMRSERLDVGIVKTSSGLRFDPKDGLGPLETTQKKVGFLDLITDQSKYKYIINVDGNVAAFRLLKSMLTGSLILRVKSEYTIWADHLLQEGKHYVSVASDLSDLNSVLDWCDQNDSKCKKIAEQGKRFAEKVLTKEFLQKYFIELLNTVQKRIFKQNF